MVRINMPSLKTLLAAAMAVAASASLAQAAPSSVVARYVVMGQDGARIARVLTTAATCPPLDAIGPGGRRLSLPLTLRQPAGTVPARSHSDVGSKGKPAAFPVSVCEVTVPADVIRVQSDGVPLPLPPARIDRIVVIGDTGCRLKQSEKAYQDCNDVAAYPFRRIAQHAADWKPELVIHVGDYLYRESPCPDDHPGCAGSPDGYGWDAWNADLFTPGAPLLQARAGSIARR